MNTSPILLRKLTSPRFTFITYKLWFNLSRIPKGRLIYTLFLRQSHDWSRPGRLTTFYQVLGVPQTATTREIKAAFIRESKKVHPDRNPGSKTAQQDFVKVKEAYEVLRCHTLRKNYDDSLMQRSQNVFNDVGYQNTGFYGNARSPKAPQSNFYGRPPPGTDTNSRVPPHNRGYYGVGRWGRASNRIILVLCFMIMVIGAALHLVSYHISLALRRVDLTQIDARNAEFYAQGRRHAAIVEEEAKNAGVSVIDILENLWWDDGDLPGKDENIQAGPGE